MSGLNALNIFPATGPHNTADATASSLTKDVSATTLAKTPRPTCLTALWLCVQKLLGAKSGWKEYIDCLPGLPEEHRQEARVEFGPGIGEVDTPIWWNQEETPFSHTLIEEPVYHMEQAWKGEFDELRDVCQHLKTAMKLDLTWTVYKWAMSIVHSRGFRSSTVESAYSKATQEEIVPKKVISKYDPETLLFPMLDMMNHSSTTGNIHIREYKKYSLICNDNPEPGDEIFNTYGFKSNAQLLLSYGFALQGNIHDYVTIKRREYNHQPDLALAFRAHPVLSMVYFPSPHDDFSGTTCFKDGPKHSVGIQDISSDKQYAAPSFDLTSMSYPIRYPGCATSVASRGTYPLKTPWAVSFPISLLSDFTITTANARAHRALKSWSDGAYSQLVENGTNCLLLCERLGLQSQLIVVFWLLKKMEHDYRKIRGRLNQKKRERWSASANTAKARARLKQIEIMTAGHALIYKSAIRRLKLKSNHAVASGQVPTSNDMILLLPSEARSEIIDGLDAAFADELDSEMVDSDLQNKVWVAVIVFVDQLLRNIDPWGSDSDQVSNDVKRQREHIAQSFGLWCQEYDRDLPLPPHDCEEQEEEMLTLLKQIVDSVPKRRAPHWRRVLENPTPLRWALNLADEELIFVCVSARSKKEGSESKDEDEEDERGDEDGKEMEVEAQDDTGQEHGTRSGGTAVNASRRDQSQSNGHTTRDANKDIASAHSVASFPRKTQMPNLYSYYAALTSETKKVTDQSRFAAVPEVQEQEASLDPSSSPNMTGVEGERNGKDHQYDEHSVSTTSFLETDVSSHPLFMDGEEEKLMLVIDSQMACVSRTKGKYAGYPILRRENKRDSNMLD
ncbi:MAG: hypothetical protein M1831_003605 [Alyxoria varia]|nr:MAG: hypothetical protein M1831_003605 [Alyxoria varia]